MDIEFTAFAQLGEDIHTLFEREEDVDA